MNTTTAATSVTAGNSWTRALRVALIPLAIVVLFVAAFVLGRSTASTAQHPPATTIPATTVATTVATSAPATTVATDRAFCRVGRPC
jgi:hypothetical protein